ncbi:MAG TPA: nodulation protein NfeD [Candidatus Acidoferrales bacterium]|nr:nodulation protein NfeD [Candidatus Acidoferrales bacterium]
MRKVLNRRSLLRDLAHALAACLPVACALLLAFPVLVRSLSVRAAAVPSDASADASGVYELQINGEIEPILAEYIVSGIDAANSAHANLILITMNTPGGLDTSMRQIIAAILHSRVPVVTYVAPSGSRAASAGFFILISADVAAMSPGTDTGAASPLLEVAGSPVDVNATLERKIMNEATAYLRSYAARRGRNVSLAVTAVTDAKAFSESEALKGNLINTVAPNTKDLLAQLNGRTITRIDGSQQTINLSNPVITLHLMNGRERFLDRIVQPDAFFILLILGVLGLYVEFTHPGLVAPGVIGGIALVLALFAMHMLPVNFTGLLLIILALVLFVLEAKYPTHGVLGVGGAIAMLIGAVMLIHSPITGGGVRPAIALAVTIPVALIVIFLMRLVLRSYHWKRTTGAEQLLGAVGEITDPIASPNAKGMVLIHGELWRAAASEPIQKGAQVRVNKIQGLTLYVEPVRAETLVRPQERLIS